ncbi:neurofilament medium polypeptide-like [Hemicordylus capensis]|uniref:neurofilament medium polypeptide-like n=1 Tax=Hemicordylus capensis TaxID=884348 RepID=UPI0023029C90|nr:neurofilament medium polypeptide-like [Hemicordylus capensis]
MSSLSRDFRSLSRRSPTPPGASLNMRRRGRSCSPSSRSGACSSPTTDATSSRNNFSSSSVTGYGHASYPKVSINKRLLTPLHLDIDPSFQEIRTKEKEEIKTLNDQFAALIGKVQSLEQHNQVLLTRWSFLREQDSSLYDFDIKLLYDQYMNKLRQEIRSIDAEKEQLDTELDEVLDAMDSFRSKYEEEINKRTGMEFSFAALKKDLDNGFLHKTELEAKLNGLHDWVELMKHVQDQELEEAMSQIKDVSVELGIDNNRFNPDLHRIVEDVRAQYEDLAIRSWEELEALTRSKLSEGELLSAKYGDHLLDDRRVIAELNIQIQKMRSCIVSLKSQCLHLEENIKEVGRQGETALNDAKGKLAKLEDALHSARQNLAHLVREYQDLMNVKLALDIEILTYRKLMEGEEISMESPSPAVISRIYSSPKHSSSNSNIVTTTSVTTKTREDSTDKMSHSRSSLESGLSRNQSHESGRVSSDDFSRSHSNRSGGTPDGSFARSHSTRRGTLESSPSRSTSSRSGNFADIEDTMESSISKSHGRGSGSFPQHDSYRSHSSRNEDNQERGLSRSPSSGIRGISEGSLPRSQSNRSCGLTDSVFARSHSGASEDIQESSYSRSHSGTSASFVEGGLSRSKSDTNEIRDSNENEEFAEPGVYRTNTAEDGGVPVGGISRSHGGSDSYISKGSLSRSQSGSSHGSEGYVEPTVSRTNSAEDGGVPVGGASRSYSSGVRNSSQGSLSRSQSGGSHGSGGFVEPVVLRTNSAEDGGVPVGDASRSYSESGRNISESSLSRSQSGGSHGSEGYVEPTVSRTNSAEDGGVPVGSASRSYSGSDRYISEGSLSRSRSGGSHGSEGYVEPTVSRTNSAEDGGVPVSGASRSYSGSDRYISEGSLSRSQSGGSHGSEGYVEPTVSRTNSAEDGGVPVGDASRSYSESGRNISESNLSRSQSGGSHGSGEYIESTVSRTNSAEDGGVPVGGISRSDSGASRNSSQGSLSRSQRDQSGGFANIVSTRAHSEGRQEGSLTRYHSGTNAVFTDSGVSRSPSYGGRGTSQDRGFRTPSIRSAALTNSVFIRTPSSAGEDVHEEVLSGIHSEARESVPEAGLSRNISNENVCISEANLSESQSSRSEGFSQSGHARLYSRESKDEPRLSRSRDASEDNLSRSHSGESGGPVDASTPICPHSRNRDAMEYSLSRSHSGGSGSFRAADFYRSSSEASRGVSEAVLSRSGSKENEHFPEGELSRSYSYGSADASHPNVSRTNSAETEDVPEGLHSSHSSASGGISQPGTYGSQSGVYLAYEVYSDPHHDVPIDEVCYYVESRPME